MLGACRSFVLSRPRDGPAGRAILSGRRNRHRQDTRAAAVPAASWDRFQARDVVTKATPSGPRRPQVRPVPQGSRGRATSLQPRPPASEPLGRAARAALSLGPARGQLRAPVPGPSGRHLVPRRPPNPPHTLSAARTFPPAALGAGVAQPPPPPRRSRSPAGP